MNLTNIVLLVQIATFIAGGALLFGTNWKLGLAQWLLAIVTGLVYLS